MYKKHNKKCEACGDYIKNGELVIFKTDEGFKEHGLCSDCYSRIKNFAKNTPWLRIKAIYPNDLM